MPRRIAVLHTSFVFINVEPVFQNLFKELIPDVGIVDFVDSDVLAAVNRDGGINQSHIRRMVHLAQAAEDAGVDLIFSACSSLGPSIDVARKMVHTPIIKIDDAMTQRAVELGSTIGVMATVPTTLPPTLDLLNQQSQAQNKPIVTKTHLVEGAWNVLMGGDRARYDRMVADGAQALAPQVDLIVLAQASMSRLAPMLSSETGKQVLSSPRLAVEYVRSLLENLGTK
ncbi:MAG: aspartate/glutamate racemase family protein [Anaerolineales bacterium]|jgi:Asp/Glu/hydantoin racemase|nr:aspartate/glutamate racemase family protein [Anaerolineales bacterium]